MAKNVQDVVKGMLSTAGSATRPPQETTPDPVSPPPSSPPASPPVATSVNDPEPAPATNTPAPRPRATKTAESPRAPRTLRLRPKTASLLREAWVEAKHEDVFLTAQDFASNLLEDALVSRRRRRASRSA